MSNLSPLTQLINAAIEKEKLPLHYRDTVEYFIKPLAAELASQVHPNGQPQPLIVGINGAQGSGKSTFSLFLALLLREQFNLNCAIISLDDFYLTKTQRQQLAKDVHPLLATRGVPGTHDIELWRNTFTALAGVKESGSVLIPRFDKAQDDRFPVSKWIACREEVDVILFEGWCVGATPQLSANLATPINELEVNDDPNGYWRRHVNTQLSGAYQELFSLLDVLVLLKIPCWDCVLEWRQLQEHKLQEQEEAAIGMSDKELERFIMHYERLTRHMLDVLPESADWVLTLDQQHSITRLECRN